MSEQQHRPASRWDACTESEQRTSEPSQPVNQTHMTGPARSHRPTSGRYPANPSKVEAQKAQSNFLRGDLNATVGNPDARQFAEGDLNVLKIHGVYQQHDRDQRLPKSQREYQLMIRARIPAGILAAEQYLALDELARDYAQGSLRLTTRQSIQYHGVLIGNLRPLLRRLNSKLISTLAACGDVMRNVTCCPAVLNDPARRRLQQVAEDIALQLAPRSNAYHEIWLDGEKLEPDDPRLAQSESPASTGTEGDQSAPASRSADEFDIEPLYGRVYLPRKFKMGIALADDNCIDLYSQDCALVADVDPADRSIRGMNLMVGGGLGMTHRKADTFARLASPVASLDVGHAVDAVRTVIEIFRDYGNREDRRHARLKYTIEEFGLDWFIDEFVRRADFPLQPPIDLPPPRYHNHLGWVDQRDGRWSYGLCIENGRLRDGPEVRALSGVRAVVAELAPGVRITPQQNLLLVNIRPQDRQRLEAILRDHGVPLENQLSLVRRNALACPALPTCGLAIAEAERALPEIIGRLEPVLEEYGVDQTEIGVRMTGCPNGCARPYTADIAFVGRSPGLYDIYVGGRLAGDRLVDLIAEKVTPDALVDRLRPLIAEYAQQRSSGEGFGDWWQRVHGRDPDKQILTGAKLASTEQEGIR